MFSVDTRSSADVLPYAPLVPGSRRYFQVARDRLSSRIYLGSVYCPHCVATHPSNLHCCRHGSFRHPAHSRNRVNPTLKTHKQQFIPTPPRPVVLRTHSVATPIPRSRIEPCIDEHHDDARQSAVVQSPKTARILTTYEKQLLDHFASAKPPTTRDAIREPSAKRTPRLAKDEQTQAALKPSQTSTRTPPTPALPSSPPESPRPSIDPALPFQLLTAVIRRLDKLASVLSEQPRPAAPLPVAQQKEFTDYSTPSSKSDVVPILTEIDTPHVAVGDQGKRRPRSSHDAHDQELTRKDVSAQEEQSTRQASSRGYITPKPQPELFWKPTDEGVRRDAVSFVSSAPDDTLAATTLEQDEKAAETVRAELPTSRPETPKTVPSSAAPETQQDVSKKPVLIKKVISTDVALPVPKKKQEEPTKTVERAKKEHGMIPSKQVLPLKTAKQPAVPMTPSKAVPKPTTKQLTQRVAPKSEAVVETPPVLKQPTPNAQCLSSDQRSWIPSVLSVQKGVVTVTLLEDEKQNVLKEPVTIPLQWVSSAERIAPDTVQLEFEDKDDPLTLKLDSSTSADTLLQQADYAIQAADVVAGDPEAVSPVYDAAVAPDRVVLKSESGETVDSIPVKSSEEALELCAAVTALQDGPPLKRLDSFHIDVLEKSEELMRLLRSTTPEAVDWLRGIPVVIYLFRSTSPARKSPVLDLPPDAVRGQLFANGTVALRLDVNTVPSWVKTMRNYDALSGYLDLTSLIRGVPLDLHSYLLTLRLDESRRLVITQFPTLIDRWAFGDVMDTLAYYSYVSALAASITVQEHKVAETLQKYLEKTKQTKVGRPVIAVSLNEPKQGRRKWASVHLRDHCLLWEDEQSAVPMSVDTLTPIDSYKRETATTLELKLKGQKDPVVFKTLKPKIQRLFAHYIKTLMARQQLTNGLSRQTDPISGALQTHKGLFEDLVTTVVEECTILARANVEVRSVTNTDPEIFVPAHFNLICTRVVPNYDANASFGSIDLALLKGITSDLTMCQHITLSPEPGQTADQQYQIRFSRLTQMYAFYHVCHRILAYFKRSNIHPPKAIEGRAVLKHGARVAPTRVERRAKAAQRSSVASPSSGSPSPDTSVSPRRTITQLSPSPTKLLSPASSDQRTPRSWGWKSIRQKGSPSKEKSTPPTAKNFSPTVSVRPMGDVPSDDINVF